jgi:hypothetical protein
MKIKRKYLPIITAVCMGLSMGIVMSFVMTMVNIGFIPGFFIKWMKAFAVGGAAGIPLAIVVVPFVNRQLQKIAVD